MTLRVEKQLRELESCEAAFRRSCCRTCERVPTAATVPGRVAATCGMARVGAPRSGRCAVRVDVGAGGVSRAAGDRARQRPTAALLDEAEELCELLEAHLLHYQAVLQAAGIPLPYAGPLVHDPRQD